jgi:ribose transport system ATP-binding protein
MKVLCGACSADAGEFLHHGEPVQIHGPADARRHGIAVIFQEFALVPSLNIAQNIFLGREFKSRIPGGVDAGRMHREARRVLDQLGLSLDTRAMVGELGVAQQQMIEIAKALSQQARILVLDEPTAALSDRETERLFAIIARLKADGVAMVYISHRMAEVFRLGDRITVLRDGRRIASRRPGETTPAELVGLMVGRKVDLSYARAERPAPGARVLEVRNVHTATGLVDVCLNVHAGEIVGLAGLVGSGRTEVARAIFGADRLASGAIEIFGRPQRGGPTEARALGVALIPEGRKTQGLALIRSVADNLLLAGLRQRFAGGWFSPRRAAALARTLIERLRIATPGPLQRAGLLSGGNQQKIVIGKWLNADARLFLFDEPTRGIDVGAKNEIYKLLNALAAQGRAIVMISSELPEILRMSHRIAVMCEGRLTGILPRMGTTQEDIMRLATQRSSATPVAGTMGAGS